MSPASRQTNPQSSFDEFDDDTPTMVRPVPRAALDKCRQPDEPALELEADEEG